MEIFKMRAECAKILLDGKLNIDEETGVLTVDLSEEDKEKLMEYAIISIVFDAVKELQQKVDK